MATVPVATKSLCHSLSRRRRELKRTRKRRQRLQTVAASSRVIRLAAVRELTGVVRVRLQAVDHVVVSFKQHEVLGGVSVPDEDVSAVGAAHHKVVSPEARLFYLHIKHPNSA